MTQVPVIAFALIRGWINAGSSQEIKYSEILPRITRGDNFIEMAAAN